MVEMDQKSRNRDNEHIKNAQQLQITMETVGWQQIVKPLLDKMIADVVGYRKKNGVWDSGIYGDKRISNAKADNLLWYRQALIDLNNHIYSYFSIADSARKRLRQKKTDTYKIPMLDTSYSNTAQPEPLEYGGAINE